MSGVNTQEFTSAAYVYTALSANLDCITSDPRRSSAITEGKPIRSFLVLFGGTLDVIRVDGTTVDSTDAVPAGVLVPCQARTVLASSGCRGIAFW